MGASSPRKIAVGQISSESNHFVDFTGELETFRATGYLLERDEVLSLATRNSGEVAGMLAVLKEAAGVEIVPLLAARGTSSGPLSEECFDYLRDGLLTALRDQGPVDGVLLSHHGSMAAIGEDDTEGAVIEAIREMLGADTPIVVTIDLHAHVTDRMVSNANALVAYKTYPHSDTYEVGRKAAELLLEVMAVAVRPVMAHAWLPMILTAFNASTDGSGPFAALMREARKREQAPDVLSCSLAFVGSYIDVPRLGCSAVVVTDGDEELARRHAAELAAAFWASRDRFLVDVIPVPEAVERGRRIQGGPVLLLDTADTSGGGAAGDSIDLVRELLRCQVTEDCLAMVVDPDAARTCAKAGVGRELTLSVGHRVDPRWGQPLTVHGTVERVSNGEFRYASGILGGSTASMGQSAVLRIGSIKLLIMERATYDWADEQYRAVGLEPRTAKFVGVKNMMNFRTGYPYMRAHYVVDLPGPTPADMRALPFRRLDRPTFPLDELREAEPRLTVHASR